MINWREYSESGFRLLIPESLQRARLGPLFKGNIFENSAETEMVVLFDPEVSISTVSDWEKASVKGPPFTEWEGLKWTYFSWGHSRVRPGGFESSFTQTAPNVCGRGHGWGITFPLDEKWLHLEITNGYGGLEWEEFKQIAERIIRSVEAI